MRRIWYLPIVLIILSITVVYAVVTFSFHETAPPIGNAAPLMSGCDPLTATPSSIPAGSSGGILFTCGTQGSMLGALTTTGPVNATLSYSPAPTVYTAIYIIPHGSTCSSLTTGTMQIFGPGSQTTISFTNPGTTQYDYCGIVTNAPASGLPSWQITWTWNQ